MSDSRAGFAETGPGVPGAGPGARHPRCDRPWACPRARPAGSIPALVWPSHRPRGQAHR